MYLHLRPGRRVPALLAFLALGACGSSPPSRSEGIRGCETRANGSRWAGGAYRVAAEYGGSEDQAISSLAGIASTDSQVYVFDAGSARVLVLGMDLRLRRVIGRQGRGPGEFTGNPPGGFGTKSGATDWIAAAGDSVLVFDGERLSLFTGGRFAGFAAREPLAAGISIAQPRIRLSPGGVVHGYGGHDFAVRMAAGRDGQPWELRLLARGKQRTLLSLTLPPLPRVDGVPFSGPFQAEPVWDAASGCGAASDGTSPWIVHARVKDGSTDTAHFRLPEREPPLNLEGISRAMELAGRGGRPAAPSAPARIRDLAVDPDGFAWLLPVQPDLPPGGIEVLRVNLSTGAAVTDTVPVFPRAFGPPGTLYGVVRDSLGGERIVRVDVDLR